MVRLNSEMTQDKLVEKVSHPRGKTKALENAIAYAEIYTYFLKKNK
jgi:hypothetical protein